MWVDDLESEADPVAVLACESALTRAQINAALRYGATHPEEIGDRMALHRAETASAPKH